MIQRHVSRVAVGAPVTFPAWMGERHYMVPFTVREGLPAELARFAPTVEAMMSGLDVDPAQYNYIMIDEAEVRPGEFHRRPGVHVDGYWHPAAQCHGGGGHGGGGHGPSPGRHGSTPGGHGSLPYYTPPAKGPGVRKVKRPPTRKAHAGEALLLASSYSSAVAYLGTYWRNFEEAWRGGDCSELDLRHMAPVHLQAGVAYHLDVFTLHESLPVREATRRTLVQINVPGVG